MTSVTYDEVDKRFGGVTVVEQLSLHINDGEFMVLLGPSGCGKSTSLRMLAGLDDPDEGCIYLDDRPVVGVPPKDRNIGMVFQSYALHPHMTVRQNIGFSLRLRRRPKSEIAARVSKAADVLELGPYLDRKPRELSGGQRQRVAVARALCREASVFLLDEPLSNLDAKLRAQARVELRRIADQVGGTYLYVTHDQTEAMTLADRIAVMREGRLVQLGTPPEVYRHPVDTFVASFIGSPPMNLTSGSYDAAEGALYLGGSRLPLRIDDPSDEPASGDIILGIRPEDLVPTRPGEQPHIEAAVQVSEFLGNDLFLHVVGAGDERLIARAPAHTSVRSGERIPLTINGHLTLFDRGSERRVATATIAEHATAPAGGGSV